MATRKSLCTVNCLRSHRAEHSGGSACAGVADAGITYRISISLWPNKHFKLRFYGAWAVVWGT